MFRRYSIETLADVILTDVKSGRINSVMLRRFYRRGKNDSKRVRSEPAGEFIVHAIGLATSKICEEYVSELQGLLDQQSALAAELAKVPFGGSESSMQGGDGPGSVTSANVTKGTKGSLERVAGLAAHRRAEQEMRRRQAAAEEATVCEGRAAALSEKISNLPSRYRQLVVSSEEVGQLLWARYSMGYEAGRRRAFSSRRRASDLPVHLTFETPCSLGTPSHATSPGGGA